MAKNTLAVRMTLNAQEFTRNLNKIKRQLNNAFGKDAIQGSEALFGKLKYLGVGIAALGAKAVKMASDFEMTKRSMTALVGNADVAAAHLRDLEKFAATTPFEFTGLVEASKRMQAYGADVDSVIPMLENLGDAAMALGLKSDGLDRMTLAVGQIMAKGKLSAEEMRQLAETGLPAWQIMSEKMGISVAELMDRSKKGAVSSKAALDALFSGMSERYSGMMKAVAGEIPQQFSNMKDIISSIMRELGSEISDALDLKSRLSKTTEWLNKFAEAAKSSGIREAISEMIPENLIVAATTLAGAIGAGLIPAISKYAVCIFGLSGQWGIMTTAIAAMSGVLMSNGADLSNYISGPVQAAIVAFGAYQTAIALATAKNLLFASSAVGWLGNIKAWISLAPAAIGSLSAFTGWLGMAGAALGPVGAIALAVGAGYWLSLRDQMKEAEKQANITREAIEKINTQFADADVTQIAVALDTARTKLQDLEIQAKKSALAMMELSNKAFLSKNGVLGGAVGSAASAFVDKEQQKRLDDEIAALKAEIPELEKQYKVKSEALNKTDSKKKDLFDSLGSGGSGAGNTKKGKSATELLVQNISDRMRYLGEDGNKFLGILDKWQAKLKPLSEDWKKIADLKLDIFGDNAQKSAEKADLILKRIQAQKDAEKEQRAMMERADSEYLSSLQWENQQGLLPDTNYFDILGKKIEELGLKAKNIFNWTDNDRATFSAWQSAGVSELDKSLSLLQKQYENGTIGSAKYRAAIEQLKVQFENLPLAVKSCDEALKALENTMNKYPSAAQQATAAWDSAREALNAVPAGIGNAFESAIRGTESLGDAMMDLLQDIGAVIAKALIMRTLFGGGEGDGFFGSGGGLFGMLGLKFHSGGRVGSGGTPTLVSPSVFANAPRMHGGGIAGLRSDEVPAILQRGEVVQPKGARSGSAGNGGDSYQITIQAIDTQSIIQMFQQNKGTLESIIVNGLQRGGALRTAVKGAM
ncbi:tape measure protein [Cloacibacillus porcorum]|uniref:tape measure protein n=1 Tax=Cloacibacillus porcorum TaxID=1197717 RepID=UPI0023F10F90|nr:tape measure protein [Cloacibacillus porcorum]MCC8185012.1 tape measure protein [Cloacibacillus porcorum]